MLPVPVHRNRGILNSLMYTHSPDPSTQYAILRKIRGSRDQAIPGYYAPQEQIPWERGWYVRTTNATNAP
jgi:hypothetical protein